MLSRHSSLLPRRWAWTRAGRRRLASVVLPVSTAVVAGLLSAAPAQAADNDRDHTALQKARYGKAEPFDPKLTKVHDPTVAAARKTQAKAERAVKWPTAAAVNVEPAESRSTATARTKAAQTTQASPAAQAADKPEVRVLDRGTTAELGIQGLVFTVAGTGDGKAATTVDYSSFADAYSGNWSSRLRLVRLPECALTTPEKAACRRTEPVASENDAEKETVTAQVAAPKAARAVLALSAAASSDQGSYEATPLAASSTWSAAWVQRRLHLELPAGGPARPGGPVPEPVHRLLRAERGRPHLLHQRAAVLDRRGLRPSGVLRRARVRQL